MLGPTDEQRVSILCIVSLPLDLHWLSNQKADMWLVQLGLLPPFDYDFVAASGLSSTTQFSPEPVAPLAPSTKSAGLRWRNLLARIQPRTTSLGKILRMGSNGSLTVSEDSRWSSGSDRTNSLFSVESVSPRLSPLPLDLPKCFRLAPMHHLSHPHRQIPSTPKSYSRSQHPSVRCLRVCPWLISQAFPARDHGKSRASPKRYLPQSGQ